MREYRRRWAMLIRRENIERGLTGEGLPRQRGRRHRYRDLDHLSPRARTSARVKRWRERELYAKGLTQKRTTPQRLGRRMVRPAQPEIAQRYREFRAGIEVPAIQFSVGRWE